MTAARPSSAAGARASRNSSTSWRSPNDGTGRGSVLRGTIATVTQPVACRPPDRVAGSARASATAGDASRAIASQSRADSAWR